MTTVLGVVISPRIFSDTWSISLDTSWGSKYLRSAWVRDNQNEWQLWLLIFLSKGRPTLVNFLDVTWPCVFGSRLGNYRRKNSSFIPTITLRTVSRLRRWAWRLSGLKVTLVVGLGMSNSTVQSPTAQLRHCSVIAVCYSWSSVIDIRGSTSEGNKSRLC